MVSFFGGRERLKSTSIRVWYAQPMSKTVTLELTRAKPLAINTAMEFEPRPPKGYRLVSGAPATNFGVVTAWRIVDGKVSVTVSGPTRPGLVVHVIGVFDKVAAEPVPTEKPDGE